MATRLSGVVIQASDVRSLSEFWTRVLGEDVVDGANGLALRFVEAEGPKQAKNRVHLDLKGGPEQLERLLELGAVRADIGQGDVPWEVLADPEGNEFCLQPPTPVDELEGAAGLGSGAVTASVAGSVPGSDDDWYGRAVGIGVHWSAVCQDAADPQAQSKFWTAAAGPAWNVVAEGDWGLAMRHADDIRCPMLVMGPPLAEKAGPNRVYLRVTPNPGSHVAVETSRLVIEGARRADGLLLDPEQNEFGVS
jgi:hypothetical protein